MQVDSTAIRDIEYDPGHRTLFVRFVSGAEYRYDGVPSKVHRAFVEAVSKGAFFSEAIRHRYPFRRLTN